MSIFQYLTSNRIRPKIISAIEYTPDWIRIPIPVGHRCLMWLRLTPAELRYVVPDKEGGVEDALLDRLSTDATVIDAGAHIGYYSLLASRRVGRKGTVTAFEPHPYHVSRIRTNAKWNRAEITVEQAAVSDTTEQTQLAIADRGGGHSLGDGEKTISVDSVTIDDYRVRNNVDPDVVKLDIEGAEVRALNGMTDTLVECEPDILCEVHPARIRDFGDSLEEMYGVLQTHGYRVLSLPEENELGESAFIRKANEGSINDYGMNTHLHIVAET